MPARTLGSWEAMTSDIISGNSTFMASAWMKVLRQNRLTFFTIWRYGDSKGGVRRRRRAEAAALWGETYVVDGVHQFGEVVEALGAGYHALLLQVDDFGQFSDVVLAHFFKGCLAFEPLQRHWSHNETNIHRVSRKQKLEKNNTISISRYIKSCQGPVILERFHCSLFGKCFRSATL